MTAISDQLAALDLTAIVDARGDITAAVTDTDLQNLLANGPGIGALGGVGAALDAVRAVAEHPEDLLSGVIEALPAASALPGFEDIDVDAWVEAVREGAALVADLIAALGGDLSRIGDLVADAAGDAFGPGSRALADYARAGVDELTRVRRLVETVEGGVPVAPEAFARLALDVLFPGPAPDVLRMRGALTGVLEGAVAIRIPATRAQGLLDAYAAVTAAAQDGSLAELERALATLARTRDATVEALEGDLRFALERLDALHVPQVLGVVGDVSAALGGARRGILEFLGDLQAEVAAARAGLAGVDPADAHTAVTGFLDRIEAAVEEQLVAPVEERVEAVEAWVSGLLAHLPLRALRAQLAGLVDQAVGLVEDADLDAPATALRERLHELERDVAELDVGQVVRAALTEMEKIIGDALTAVADALTAIGEAVDAIATGAAEVVEAAVAVLRQLADAVDQAKQAIDELPIEEARDEVVAGVRELREQAEELLSQATLPDALRPIVGQLVEELRNVDLEGAILGPVDEALAKFHVLEDIGLTQLVADVQNTLSNLVPAQIADEIQAEIDHVLDGIRAFRPEGIKAAVEGFLDEAADAVETVDLKPVREVVHAPFAVVLGGFDELKPSTLLRPVLAAYDDLVGSAALPDPEQASEQLVAAAAGAAATLRPPLGDQAARLAPGAARTTPTVPAQLPPGLPRAGDAVRLLGWLPAKLREALAAAGGAAATAAAAALADLTGGLAADLRGLQGVAYETGDRLARELDALLQPLAAAQARAQLALVARITAPADAPVELDVRVELDASLEVLASAGPLAIRELLTATAGLVGDAAGRLATDVARAGGAVDGAAAALERSPLAALGADADALLAALDPEPLAAELDGLVEDAVAKLPAFVDEFGDDLEAMVMRVQRLVLDHNPAALLQRFLRVLDTVRDELELLNPHTLAAELDRIHDAARATLEAYDPAQLVDEVGNLLEALATAIRDVDLSGFPGQADLATLGAAVQKVEDAVPTAALAQAGEALKEAGDALREFDLVGLVAEVEELPGRVQEAMHAAVRAVKDELLALLGALHYQQTSASAEVSVG